MRFGRSLRGVHFYSRIFGSRSKGPTPRLIRRGFFIRDIYVPVTFWGAERLYSCAAKVAFRRNIKKIMLWTVIIVLLVLWLLGFGFKIGGSFIHVLLVVALIVLIIRLLS